MLPQYSPKALTFRRPGHYAYRSSHSKAQIFAEDRFGIIPREMVLGPSSLHFRRVLLPQDRRRPDLHQLFSQRLRFPTFSGSFLTPSGSSWSQNQRGLAGTGISPTNKLWLCFTTARLARWSLSWAGTGSLRTNKFSRLRFPQPSLSS